MDLSKELEYSFSRSGGKGGQNVNKVETKVQVRFHIANSQLLSEEQKEILHSKLANKLTESGEIVLTCQKTRSQLKNKGLVTQQLLNIIEGALIPRKRRKKSKIPESVKRKRLKDKKIKSAKKENRRRINSSD